MKAWHEGGSKVGIGLRRRTGQVFATLNGEIVGTWNKLKKIE